MLAVEKVKPKPAAQKKEETIKDPAAQELLNYNNRGALSHMLAVEEHLQQLGGKEAPHSHCVRKHSLLAVDHHLSEAVNHASRIDPAIADDYRDFRERAQRVLRLDGQDLRQPPKEPLDLGEVAAMRNDFRRMIGESTVDVPCSTCDLDGGAGAKKRLEKALADEEAASAQSRP